MGAIHRGPEKKPTWTPVELGQARYVRTLRGDEKENQGVYLAVGFEPEGDEEARWRLLVVAPYSWHERAGQVVTHAEAWLQEWTEPLCP